MTNKTKLLTPLRLSGVLGVMTFFYGCAPAPLTDEQVTVTTQRCRELGMATAIFNSGIVSQIQCVPIINGMTPNFQVQRPAESGSDAT